MNNFINLIKNLKLMMKVDLNTIIKNAQNPTLNMSDYLASTNKSKADLR